MITLISEAHIAAVLAHQGQTRRGSPEPYITHPVRVAATVINSGAPEEVAAAAYLHDVLEDTDYGIATFPEQVQELVAALTGKGGKVENVEKLSGNKWALLIKLADRVDNLSDESDYRDAYLDRTSVLASSHLLLQLATQVDLQDTAVFHKLESILNSLP